MRSTALGGFDSPRLDLRKSPLAGVMLEDVSTSNAVLTALGHLQAPFVVAALVALAGFGPDQAPPRQPPLDGGALERQVTHCWAPLMALRYTTLAGIGLDQASPLHAPFDGAALVALPGTEHQLALGWASLVTPVPQGAGVLGRTQDRTSLAPK